MSDLISAIIPVYNGQPFLAEAIHSVLRQKIQPLQLIIVDDGSTDDTAHITQRLAPDATYVYQPNRGPAAARNRGLQLARGPVIAFLDADDYWHDKKLTRQYRRLQADPALQLVLGHTQFVRQTDSQNCMPFHEPYPQFLLGSALFRRALFTTVGPFDESLTYCDDWDWFLRAHEQEVPLQMTPDVVLYHRRHRRNLTNSPESRRELLHLVHKGLQRSRARSQTFSLPAWFNADRRTGAYD